MEICNHIIREDQVIGIGPLMVQQSSDQVVRMMYNSRQLWFWLHLKFNSIKIESDWFDLGQGHEKDKKHHELYDQFKKQYEDAKGAVIKIVERNAVIS